MYVHPPVTIINKTLDFRFIQLIMHIVFIIDHIHHLMNESKMQNFAYNCDQKVYKVREMLTSTFKTFVKKFKIKKIS